MSDKYIVVKYKEDSWSYEIFENVEDLLRYVIQEAQLKSKFAIFKFGECIGDFS